MPSLAGLPTAVDIAVTAAQRSESLREASQHPGAAATAYSQVKADHLRASELCAEQGVRFLPLVVESTGNWPPAASRALKFVAQAAAAREGADVPTLFGEFLQELCVTARRWRARAVHRRRAELANPAVSGASRHAAALLLAADPCQ